MSGDGGVFGVGRWDPCGTLLGVAPRDWRLDGYRVARSVYGARVPSRCTQLSSDCDANCPRGQLSCESTPTPVSAPIVRDSESRAPSRNPHPATVRADGRAGIHSDRNVHRLNARKPAPTIHGASGVTRESRRAAGPAGHPAIRPAPQPIDAHPH